MTTRTTGKRGQLGLIERMQKRDHEGKPVIGGSRRYYTRQDHIRAELDRIARQVRKMEYTQMSGLEASVVFTVLNDVLAIIKEAKK